MDQAVAILEENLASLFQPDTLLSARYFENFRRNTFLDPEKRLMLAIFEDAVRCFQNYLFARDSRGKRAFLEAEEWTLETNSDWLFSFENICEVLGFDPRYVRLGLMRWKQRKLAERLKERGGLHEFFDRANASCQ